MGGGGGGGGGGYEAEYRAYEHAPAPYQGQNEINEAARNIIAQGETTIRGRVIPNFNGIDYYREVARLNMIQTDTINKQTELYTEQYPKFMINKIVQIEEVYQRINDYLRFMDSFDIGSFKGSLDKHSQWFEVASKGICDMLNRADYYKNRAIIQQAIQKAILGKRVAHLNAVVNPDLDPNATFELEIPEDPRLSREDFIASYVSDVGGEKRIYLSLTASQTGSI
jgi:hypothetical protein